MACNVLVKLVNFYKQIYLVQLYKKKKPRRIIDTHTNYFPSYISTQPMEEAWRRFYILNFKRKPPVLICPGLTINLVKLKMCFKYMSDNSLKTEQVHV